MSVGRAAAVCAWLALSIAAPSGIAHAEFEVRVARRSRVGDDRAAPPIWVRWRLPGGEVVEPCGPAPVELVDCEPQAWRSQAGKHYLELQESVGAGSARVGVTLSGDEVRVLVRIGADAVSVFLDRPTPRGLDVRVIGGADSNHIKLYNDSADAVDIVTFGGRVLAHVHEFHAGHWWERSILDLDPHRRMGRRVLAPGGEATVFTEPNLDGPGFFRLMVRFGEPELSPLPMRASMPLRGALITRRVVASVETFW